MCPGCQRKACLGICAESLSFSPWATDIVTAWDLHKCINRSTAYTLPFKIREKADNHWFITILKIFWVLIDFFLMNTSLRYTFHVSSESLLLYKKKALLLTAWPSYLVYFYIQGRYFYQKNNTNKHRALSVNLIWIHSMRQIP